MNGKYTLTITIKLNLPKHFNEDESFIFISKLIHLWFQDYRNVYYKLDFDTNNNDNSYYTKYEYDNNSLYNITLVELLNLLNIDTQLCDSVYQEFCSLSTTIDNFIDSLRSKYPNHLLSVDLLELHKIKLKITKLRYCIKTDKHIDYDNTRTCTLTIKLDQPNDKILTETSHPLNNTLDYLLYELVYNDCTNVYFKLDLNIDNNRDYTTNNDYMPYSLSTPFIYDYWDYFDEYFDIYDLFYKHSHKDISISIDQFTEKVHNDIYLLLNALEDNYEWVYRLIIKQTYDLF